MATSHCGRFAAALIALLGLVFTSLASDSYDYTESRQFKKNLAASKYRNNTYWLPGYTFKPPEKSYVPRESPAWEKSTTVRKEIDDETRKEQEKWEMQMQEISRKEREKWKRYREEATEEPTERENSKQASNNGKDLSHGAEFGKTERATEEASRPRSEGSTMTPLTGIQSTTEEAGNIKLSQTMKNILRDRAVERTGTKTETPLKGLRNGRWGMNALGSPPGFLMEGHKHEGTGENHAASKVRTESLSGGIHNGRWGIVADEGSRQLFENVGNGKNEAGTRLPLNGLRNGRWGMSDAGRPSTLLMNNIEHKKGIEENYQSHVISVEPRSHGVHNGRWGMIANGASRQLFAKRFNEKVDDKQNEAGTRSPLKGLRNGRWGMSETDDPERKQNVHENYGSQRVRTESQLEGLHNGRWGMIANEASSRFSVRRSHEKADDRNAEAETGLRNGRWGMSTTGLYPGLFINNREQEKDIEENDKSHKISTESQLEGIQNGRWGMIDYGAEEVCDRTNEAKPESQLKGLRNGRWGMSADVPSPRLLAEIVRKQKIGDHSRRSDTDTPFKRIYPRVLEQLSKRRVAGRDNESQIKTKFPFEGIQNSRWGMSVKEPPLEFLEELSRRNIANENNGSQLKANPRLNQILGQKVRDENIKTNEESPFEGLQNGRWGMSMEAPSPKFLEEIAKPRILGYNDEPRMKTKSALDQISGLTVNGENNNTDMDLVFKGLQNGRWGMIRKAPPSEFSKEIARPRTLEHNYRSQLKTEPAFNLIPGQLDREGNNWPTELTMQEIRNDRWGMSIKEPPADFSNEITGSKVADDDTKYRMRGEPASNRIMGKRVGEKNEETNTESPLSKKGPTPEFSGKLSESRFPGVTDGSRIESNRTLKQNLGEENDEVKTESTTRGIQNSLPEEMSRRKSAEENNKSQTRTKPPLKGIEYQSREVGGNEPLVAIKFSKGDIENKKENQSVSCVDSIGDVSPIVAIDDDHRGTSGCRSSKSDELLDDRTNSIETARLADAEGASILTNVEDTSEQIEVAVPLNLLHFLSRFSNDQKISMDDGNDGMTTQPVIILVPIGHSRQ